MKIFAMISSAAAQWLGIERNQTSHGEKLISALAAGLGIGLTVFLSMWLMLDSQIGLTGSLLIISSMGASAVLLFAVPHSALSQPWPVILSFPGVAILPTSIPDIAARAVHQCRYRTMC